MYIYTVEHEDGPLDEYGEMPCEGDTRYVGIFTSKKKALRAMKKVQNKKGFSKHKNSFHIGKAEVGSLWWEEGFFICED